MATWRRALVTGASAGIGDALARRLAADGTDLVVVARRVDRLEKLAEELRATGRHVEVLPGDLTDPDDLARVVDRVAGVDEPVDLMVNNAAAGAGGPFWRSSSARARAQIELNVAAVVALTHAALGRMVPDGAGTVLNVSSLAGFQALPGMAVYSATKAFVTTFTEAVAAEVAGTGVTVTAVCPGITRTEFHEAAGLTDQFDRVPAAAWMSADSVARLALDAAARHRVLRVTGWRNRVLGSLSTLTPRGIRRRASAAGYRRSWGDATDDVASTRSS